MWKSVHRFPTALKWETSDVYELANFDLLRDVFVWAYERFCRRYIATRAKAAEPGPQRLPDRAARFATPEG